MFKGEKGITLVALVITIIVLLILAGVSISLVVGSDGVLGKATNAVSANEKATAEQEIKLAVAECQVNYYDTWVNNQNTTKAEHYKLDVFTANCTSAATNGVAFTTTVTGDEGTLTVTYKTKSNVTYTFNVDISDGEVTEPSGS